MSTTLTTKLQNDTTRLFFDDVANNDFYFMISSVSTDELVRIDAVNSLFSKNQFKENIVFGKKIFAEDVKYMIKYYPWQKDSVYTQYDDTIDLSDKNFYAVVGPTNNDSGDYRVYKCLSNNNGAASTTPPNYNPTTVNQIYRTPDGYVWKYMYYLTEPQFEAYNAVGYIPLIGTFEVNPDPEADANNVITGSELSDIFVENYIDNNGYPNLQNGQVTGPPGNDGTIKIRAANISTQDNYYAGMTIYAANKGTGESYTYVIDSYTFDETSSNEGTLKVIGTPQADGLLINASFTIVPTIKISGDGEGAVAIPRIVDGNITNIEVLSSGKNYNNIKAEVIDPQYDFDPYKDDAIDVKAKLRPVLSPMGYHNWNLIDELHCRHILLYAYMTETDSIQVGQTNTYSALGVVKNAVFSPDGANTALPDVFDNRIAITTNDYGKVAQNSVVYQRDANNDITFSAIVHEIDEDANTIYLSNYMGAYTNAANNDISLDPTEILTNSTGQSIQINTPVEDNIIESRYKQRSGTVYFMEDFFPLERTETSREEYKLVLEF